MASNAILEQSREQAAADTHEQITYHKRNR
jgi:hypothetical protein